MKRIPILAIVALLAFSCKESPKEVAKSDTADMAEATNDVVPENEWTALSIDHWQAFKGGEVPKFWKVEDDAIVFHPPTAEEREKPDGGRASFNIVTKKEYTNFVLSLEWKMSEKGNSGIMWGVSEDDKFGEPYQTGLEIQLLDNDKHPDAKNGPTRQAGALYDLVPPPSDVTKPVGEWNTAIITINHETNEGTSVLNGVEVAKFPVNGEALQTLLKGSKFENWDGFGLYKTGKIALQDHGDVVSFRNIKIKEL
ncbi:DUF1080 domain-containing protein [Maribacter chungangensis]|uniref:DUF1080 domain-containing protein n=1 Tax=Maribacter chungangensis TaxID=1069117 RepID=A0ABW3AYV3_9FLAO